MIKEMVREQTAEIKEMKVSGPELRVYIRGIDYPADRDEVLRHAKLMGTPENAISAIECLPCGQYQCPTGVDGFFDKAA